MGLFGKKKKGGGLEQVAEAAAQAGAEAPADGAAAEQQGERRKNWWQRLREGLSKTVGSFFGNLRAVVLGRRVDEELIEQVWDQLIAADMGPDLADKVTDRLRKAWKRGEVTDGEQVIPFLKQQFIEVLTAKGNEVNLAATPPTVILVVGVNGTGKTTSIGKLAWYYQEQEGKKVMIAACDTFRAAAESQLEIWATERVGCAFHKGEPKSDPASVAYTAAERAKDEGIDVLIVDTAGRLHTDRNLMEQLAKIKRSLGRHIDEAPHETLLVVDANYGQNVIQQTEKFLEAADVTGLFLAKLDATGKGGVVLNIHERFDVPVKFVGTGEQREDFAAFDATGFVEALFAEQ